MVHIPFIVAAYAITIAGVLGLLALSFVRMRRAERRLGDDR